MNKITELAQAIDRNTSATVEAIDAIQSHDNRQKEIIEKARNGGASDEDFNELISILDGNTSLLNNMRDTQNQTNILKPSPSEPLEENLDKAEDVDSDETIEVAETDVGLPGSVAIDIQV